MARGRTMAAKAQVLGVAGVAPSVCTVAEWTFGN